MQRNSKKAAQAMHDGFCLHLQCSKHVAPSLALSRFKNMLLILLLLFHAVWWWQISEGTDE